MPCNGRFPTLIALLTMFFVGAAGGAFSSLLSALLLTGVIISRVAMTFVAARLLSKPCCGVPSSFTLELPPTAGRRSAGFFCVRCSTAPLFVLGRAATVATPAGLVIWLMANVTVGGASVLAHCAAFLDPLPACWGSTG